MVFRSAPAAASAVLALLLLVAAMAGLPSAARAQDAAELLVRVNRLENQIRQMSGQIEQLQFQNQKLQEQFAKYQQDVEFRFQELKGGAKPAATATPATPPQPAANAKPQKRSDAFDPASQPAAPGAPRTLGNLPGEQALPGAEPGSIGTLLSDEEDGPMDLGSMGRTAALPQGTLPPPGLPPGTGVVNPSAVQGTAPRPVGGAGPAASPSVAAVGTGSPRDSYDLAYGLVLQKQYDQAEMAFRNFLQSHPRDKLVPDATYWLGETYYRRGRFPDAVEQYVKIYKTFGTSRVAPESMLKMSMSLRGMNQPDQACRTLAAIGQKYPDAPAEVKAGVQREQKRGNC